MDAETAAIAYQGDGAETPLAASVSVNPQKGQFGSDGRICRLQQPQTTNVEFAMTDGRNATLGSASSHSEIAANVPDYICCAR